MSRGLCIHEAAHAISAQVQGLPYGEAIVDWEAGIGCVRYRWPRGYANPDTNIRRLSAAAFCLWEKEVICLLAGPVGESLYTGEDRLQVAFHEASDDAQNIVQLGLEMLESTFTSYDKLHLWLIPYRERAEAIIRAWWRPLWNLAENLYFSDDPVSRRAIQKHFRSASGLENLNPWRAAEPPQSPKAVEWTPITQPWFSKVPLPPGYPPGLLGGGPLAEMEAAAA